MGAIPGLLGLGSGGVNWKAQSANLENPVSVAQAQNAYQQAQQGIDQQQNFVNALNAQNGIGNQSSVFNQLQNVASGQGPNPAQAMLNNATGNNIAQQAALMAGQRGAGANAGLLARQAAMQGGNLQQNAVGQGAALQAQQSLGALNQLGGIAGQQVGQQQQGLQTLNQAQQSEQAQLLGAIQNQNQNQLSNIANQNNANSQIQNTIAGGAQKTAGGLFNGLGAITKLFAAGGQVTGQSSGPSSMAAQHLLGMHKGGKVPAIVSPGELYLPPDKVEEFKQQPIKAIKEAERIPGKAKVSGDSLKNDTVEKELDEGGVVVPRSKAQAKDSVKKSVDFVADVIEKKKKGKK